MKKDTKLFLILFGLSLVSAILVLPYVVTLQGELLAQVPMPLLMILLISVFQSAGIFALAVFAGINLSKRIGFGAPLIESWLEKKQLDYKKTAIQSMVIGVVVGVTITLLAIFVFPEVSSASPVPIWQGFLASFYGGIAEEVLMRFFLMSLLIFGIMKLARRNKPNSPIIWFSIIFIAVIFGLGHLPVTAAMTEITEIIVLRAIVLNGIGGVAFGWLYCKKGLESAIIAHFCADIVLHVIVPFGMG